ncbi:entry exclusion protein 1 [Cronobacter sakazakii]|uniref:entry exclusion protein 1 n=1 Tax=Cronobacter TaxID=413496 RepID=UPI000BE79F16|nr:MULTISPECIES: entry exclusion protein 1 [Cronobacter]EBX8442754.1 entry exclusion protein 1 [Salmonella enterica subsp. enterica serovar Oranienburg]ELY2676823.1 entry exclusion protein 1 [Cronobacter sakazakii]ELY2751972.1 entry exclusion protein 1 [Cronobacter sakazakii]ELY2794067.1 entry exclusion protein 1 [Cronobacter sakazakii]ELY2905557.1 entry exclusion protein 1 [Cronobacter sakazakii]
MAWHSVSQAQKLTGKSRRTLYRDMASGRVSYRNNTKGHRELETSELIRVYGELELIGTDEGHSVTQPYGPQNEGNMMEEIRALRQEIGELKSMLLRLEHKDPAAIPRKPWWRFWHETK